LEIYAEKLTYDFNKNVRMVDDVLKIGDSFDIIKRKMNISGSRIVMYYIDGFIKAEMMERLNTHLLSVKDFGDGTGGAAQKFAEEQLPSIEVDPTGSVDQIVLMVMSGCTAFLCEGFGANALIIDVRTYPARGTEEPANDRVMRGARDGFVETMIFNTALIRRRIRDPNLTVKYLNVSTSSRTDLALCYMSNIADMDYVNQLAQKLESIKTDSLVLGHQSVAESLIKQKWYNPFPKIRITERPDTAAACLLEGNVILLCDNSPEAMIFPTSIFDFLQETDDFYVPPLTGTYLRIVRHFVFWFTMVITPMWYLLLMNETILPEGLQFIVPSEPGKIPIIAQLFLTEFALDGLKLASLNTPNALSNSLSVVGGLLLGDFAVKVGWLTPDVIFYMAFVSIANLTQSSYELGYTFKYFRMMILLLTAIFNIWGFIAGFLIALILVCANKTPINGKRNYLYPLIPFDAKALARLFFRLKKDK